MRILFEASAISQPKVSGIGHTIVETIRALEELNAKEPAFGKIVLLVPYRNRQYIKRWNFKSVELRYFWSPMKILVWLDKLHLLPPISAIYGRGIYVFPNYLNLPVGRSSRLLTYIHDIGFIAHPEFVSPKNQRYLQAHVPRWMRRSDKVITVSEFSKQEIAHTCGVPTDKISVIPNGVDTKLFYRRDENEVTKSLNKYDISARDYIFYFGNIEPRKNIMGILNAYDALDASTQQQHPLLLIGGSGWLTDDIDRRIAELRQKGMTIIRPAAYVEDEDLPAIYSGARMLLHPAHYEGFGISPLQAMACSVPVITSNAASLPEVVADAALQVDPEDTAGLTAAINTLLKDKVLTEKLVKKGLQRSRSFSWDNSARKLVKIARNG